MIWYINVALIAFMVGVVFGVALTAYLLYRDARERDASPASEPEPKEIEYCWMRDGSCRANGPHPSVEAAREEALDYYALKEGDRHKREITITIFDCLYLDPEDWIGGDVDWILERMDEAVGDGVPLDDLVFTTRDNKAADEALAGLLRSWAREHVEIDSVAWITGTEIESFKIGIDGKVKA
jgi:hypothetical protein